MCAEAVLDMLVVDDESDLRERSRDAFTSDGHRVTAVADGRSAIDRASTGRFDVVLLDVALGPGPDGFEVCRTLRGAATSCRSSCSPRSDSEADAVLGLEAGADDYVTKPFGAGRAAQPHPRRAAARRPARLRRGGAAGGPRRARPAQPRGHRRRPAGGADLLGVRAAGGADGRARSGSSTARSCCARSGATAPTATRAASTSTSATCARSSRSEPEHPRLILTQRGVGYRLHLP